MTSKKEHMESNNDCPIGHREDALTLLDEMIAKCKHTNATAPDGIQSMDKAVGSTGYFWPRLTALRDAIAREIV
jgi:hypothetical protein